MKKAAVMVYPMFSMQEISCTTELFKFYDKEIVTFSAGREPVKSEDGFTILPDMVFEEFRREDFDCLVLPGIWDPLPVMLDERNIRFLERFRGDDRFVIGSISSSPLLLGKAGLLEGKRFTHGLFGAKGGGCPHISGGGWKPYHRPRRGVPGVCGGGCTESGY